MEVDEWKWERLEQLVPKCHFYAFFRPRFLLHSCHFPGNLAAISMLVAPKNWAGDFSLPAVITARPHSLVGPYRTITE